MKALKTLSVLSFADFFQYTAFTETAVVIFLYWDIVVPWVLFHLFFEKYVFMPVKSNCHAH